MVLSKFPEICEAKFEIAEVRRKRELMIPGSTWHSVQPTFEWEDDFQVA
jgi:hypothetical protein